VSLARPADLVVVALAALAVGASWGAFWGGGGPAEAALISAPGQPPLQLALHEDTEVEVRGRIGVSRLEVRDARVRFVDSPCVGRQCVHSGWLAKSGQLAACLPNGVVLEVIGGEREFDAISF
jgi:hypothetical protein